MTMWQNLKTQNLTKIQNRKCFKTQKLKMGQNSNTQHVTKTQKLKYDKKNQDVSNLITLNCGIFLLLTFRKINN